jgi:hypothetical protein
VEELEDRLRDHLQKTLGATGLSFAERPTRVSGGFDTQIFAFRLAGAPPAFSGPLILRLLDVHHDPARALTEQATQNALADLGYPAPRAVLASADVTPGTAFTVRAMSAVTRWGSRNRLEIASMRTGGAPAAA